MFKIDEIYKLNFSDENSLFLINDFISELIPVFHSSPYRIKKEDTVESLYERFKNREIGGWCGLTTSYMLMVLKKCNVSAEIYNYGIAGTEFTHTIIIADGYPLDPYFNKYYVYIDDTSCLIKFDILLQKIAERDFSFLNIYGTLSIKTKRIDTNKGYRFISMTGLEWEKSLMNSWKLKAFSETMKSKFGNDNPYLLMLNRI